MPGKKLPLAERLKAKQWRDPKTGCLLFMGARDPIGGYGIIGRAGRGTGVLKAHRVAAFLAGIIDSLDDPRLVCHKCDNPPCTDPDHLEAGDKVKNATDAVKRGLWGSRKHSACKNGHPFSEENSYISPIDGRRRCRLCRTAATYKSRAKRTAA